MYAKYCIFEFSKNKWDSELSLHVDFNYIFYWNYYYSFVQYA